MPEKNYISIYLTFSFLLFIIVVCNAQEIDRRSFYHKKNKSVKEVQQVISYNLDKIKYFNFSSIRIPNKYIRAAYFTEAHCQRIIEILQNKWREDELENRVKIFMKSVLDTIRIDNRVYTDAREKAKRDSLPLSQIWNDIIMKRRKRNIKSISESNVIPISIIRIAGFIRDKRFIPYLENILKKGIPRFKNSVLLSLARLQVEPYHSQVIAKYSQRKDYVKLSFVCTKKAINEIVELTKDNKFSYEQSDDPSDVKYYDASWSIYTLSFLYHNDDLYKKLHELEVLDREKVKQYYQEFPKNIEDLDKMRVILNKYYGDYTMKDVNCDNPEIDLGW